MRPPTAAFSGYQPVVEALLAASHGVPRRIGRAEALSVPAVLRGRNMVVGSISSLPLRLYAPDLSVVSSPLFGQIDPDVPNVVTMAMTVEDLFFEGIAWWRVTGFGWDGYPASARHVDVSKVSLRPPVPGGTPDPLPSGDDPRGASVWIDGEQVPANQVIRFDSPNPGVLRACARPIRRALLLDAAAGLYAENPRPMDYFTPAEDTEDPEDDEEVRDLLAHWQSARKKSATAFVPRWLTYHTVDTPTPAELQLVELQRQAALDLANALSVDPEELGISTTSRTYANAVDRRRDRINDTLAPYMRAITDRLSMGDVTKRGWTVGLDLDDYLKSNPTERWAMHKTASDLGVTTPEEIRMREKWGPMPAGARPEPAAAEELPPPADDRDTAPVDQVDAARPAALTFDAGLTFADLPVTQFSVDVAKRTITGLAVPYGKRANKGGLKFRFDRGSLRWTDPSRVKLLRDHDFAQPLGKALTLTESHAGLKIVFKVARGPEGDRALELAEDGVLDGLSVGVDFDMGADTVPDPADKAGVLVRRADLREVSLTAMPSFDDARVTKVAASMNGRTTVEPETEPTPAPEPTPATGPVPVTYTAEQVAAMFAQLRTPPAAPPVEAERPQPVNPTRLTAAAAVDEALPYRFDRAGRFVASDHEFATDLRDMLRARDAYGTETDAGRRVMALVSARFDVDTADVNELNPTINRPDMYVDQRDYRTPLWNFVNKGAPPNGVQPFMFPKFSSASGLVGDHTEGTEPSSGTFVTTSQTVTPTAISGKASITREVWDMGGNPAVSTLIFNQMVRGWREGLESATATFLNTLTAATDLTITTAAVDDALAASWEGHLVGLQFVRGYDFSAFALEQVLYKAFAAARDDGGRPIYPMLNPQNANGTVASRFRTMDLGGVTGVPSWALASTPGSANNSWLFDPSVVHGWSTAPQRLEFAGSDPSDGSYAPTAFVDLAIWGYKAFANSDIGGVRQVIYDSTS